nr:DEAD/DEAH box helicase [Demequina soli]
MTDADLLPLTDAVIGHHLSGDPERDDEFHVGLYPMMRGDRCRLLVCDFDDGPWRLEAAAYARACRDSGFDALAEISRSGDGAHVWLFFDEPVPASAARALGATLLRKAMATRASISLTSYDRFFPSQDTLPERSTGRMRLGNLIALPLQGDCRRRGTSVFADPDSWEPLPDQFAALAAVRRIPTSALEEAPPTAPRLRSGPLDDLRSRPRRTDIRSVAREIDGRAITIRRDATVHVPVVGVPAIVIAELKHAASVANPEFYRRQAQRFSTFGVPRLVTCFEHDENELRLPRGLFDQTRDVLAEAGFNLEVAENPVSSPRIQIDFSGALRDDQRAAVDAVLAHDLGVLVAPPGAGKTVMACALIAERSVATAILVNRAELLQQWRARLTQFLSIEDKQIGQLGGGRRKRRGMIDLIMMQSIAHRSGDPRILEEYGQVIVDECHAIAAPAVEAAIRSVNVIHWTGLTATPYRADQMDGLITMQVGPIRHTIAAAPTSARLLVVHETAFSTEESGADGPSIQAIYSELSVDTARNALIIGEVTRAAKNGGRCLVLTNRLDHLETLTSALAAALSVPVIGLHGRLKPADRRALRARISELGAGDEPFVLVAMDKIAGEGIDLPSLDTLFLAVPVSFKGRIIQQVGRVTRSADTAATVHDFRDSSVPLLERMHGRRRRVLAKEGFAVDRSA